MSEQTIQQAKTDPGWVEVWRERPGDYYADSVSVHPERRAVRVNAGGYVRTHPFEGQSAGETPAPQEPTDCEWREWDVDGYGKPACRTSNSGTNWHRSLAAQMKKCPECGKSLTLSTESTPR